MKKLVEYILEKLKINKDTKLKTIEYNKSNYKIAINDLKEEAKKYNCKIVFKNHPDGNTGDFTIFIYKNGSTRYDVGFDGSWDSQDLTFDKCYHQSLEWLEKHQND